ncbi:hypothetical protein LUZ60_002023 [Juncus effusus]|nr:hypothetical protein LUZ60_002023 [Juncus effusus]
MGKKGKERARERKAQRLQEISHLRTIPYSPQDIWWSSETIAVVTGSNRGIGFEIARQLAVHGIQVILTSRNSERAEAAAEILRNEGLRAHHRQLDIADVSSVEDFARWIQLEFGGIDILVNNAGVNFNKGSENSVEFAETVISTNYYGTKRMIETFLPLMKPSPCGARIVNVSSRLGRADGRRNRISDTTLREKLTKDESLSEDLLHSTLTRFLAESKSDTWRSSIWPGIYTDYSLSKFALNAYTRLTAIKLAERPEGKKVFLNCFCPGWVRTEMTGWEGNTEADVAADTGVWLALVKEGGGGGKFYAERREIKF